MGVTNARELADAADATPGFAANGYCLHQLFDQQARRTPDETALIFEHQRLTYAQLQARADTLASYLSAVGVRPGVLVGLFVERSLEMVLGILGILKTGGAYLPINPSCLPEQIAFMLDDARVPLLLTQYSLLSRVPASDTPAVCLESFDRTEYSEPARRDFVVTPEDIACVVYSGGSTERPSGIEHGNIVNRVLGAVRRQQLKPGMHHATASTIAADLGSTVIFPALVTGGCLHVVAQKQAVDQASGSAWTVSAR